MRRDEERVYLGRVGEVLDTSSFMFPLCPRFLSVSVFFRSSILQTTVTLFYNNNNRYDFSKKSLPVFTKTKQTSKQSINSLHSLQHINLPTLSSSTKTHR